MLQKNNYDRRRFLGAAAIAMAAGPLLMIGGANAQPVKTGPLTSDKSSKKINASSSIDIKQINAGLLNIG